jgi:hypothetical protein
VSHNEIPCAFLNKNERRPLQKSNIFYGSKVNCPSWEFLVEKCEPRKQVTDTHIFAKAVSIRLRLRRTSPPFFIVPALLSSLTPSFFLRDYMLKHNKCKALEFSIWSFQSKHLGFQWNLLLTQKRSFETMLSINSFSV